MPKPKYYVVWKGRRSGVFSSWADCAAQVSGYTGAQYKAFDSMEEAQRAFRGSYAAGLRSRPPRQDTALLRRFGKPLPGSYAVDAACQGNPGQLEYRCVYIPERSEIFHEGPFQWGTNNVGEFLAIVHALMYLKEKRISAPLYSDSDIAIRWVTHRRCRTKLARTKANSRLFDLIAHAEKWLQENQDERQLLKWQTRLWGEIPADFGRK